MLISQSGLSGGCSDAPDNKDGPMYLAFKTDEKEKTHPRERLGYKDFKIKKLLTVEETTTTHMQDEESQLLIGMGRPTVLTLSLKATIHTPHCPTPPTPTTVQNVLRLLRLPTHLGT